MATPSVATPSPALVAAGVRPIPEITAHFRNGIDHLLLSGATWEDAPENVDRDLASVDATLRGLSRLLVELRQALREVRP